MNIQYDWVRRFALFHGKRHPRDLWPSEVEAFLTNLAVHKRVSASTQNQAKSAILFLFKEVNAAWAACAAHRPGCTASEWVRELHGEDLAAGYGSVYLPYALNRKYPNAAHKPRRLLASA